MVHNSPSKPARPSLPDAEQPFSASPLTDPYSLVNHTPESEQNINCCSGATSAGGGLHLTFVDDPGLASLHKDQMRASAIIDALMRAARDGDVSLHLSLNSVTFEWRDMNDALFVFEAITARPPRVLP